MRQADIDRLPAWMVPPQCHLIASRAAESRNRARMDVISRIDGRRVTTLGDGGGHEIDAAVAAARAVNEKGVCSHRASAARRKTRLAFAELIEVRAFEPAILGVRNNGTEIGMAYKAAPLSAAATRRRYAEAIDEVYGEVAPTAPEFLALVQREPLGVGGVIVPWNSSLLIAAWKIAPVLAAGNSVVAKPSAIASLTLQRLAGLALADRLPEAVFNVIIGRDSGGAAPIRVNALAFTGSGPTGGLLPEASARSNLERVHLELGGKSANIVFADAPDLKIAAKASAQSVLRDAGQVCGTGSRLLVERSIHDDFIAEIARCASAKKFGDPRRLDTDIGAVVSEARIKRNLDFVAGAKGEGARLVCRGQRILEKSGAAYMASTGLADVAPTVRLFQEELFGPILVMTPFDDEAEAIRLANATRYALAGAVWTANLSRAQRMVNAMRSGVVHVATMAAPTSPHRWAASVSPASAATRACTHSTATRI